VNRERLKVRKSYAKVIRRPYFDLFFQRKYIYDVASLYIVYASNMVAVTIVDRMTSLLPHIYLQRGGSVLIPLIPLFHLCGSLQF